VGEICSARKDADAKVITSSLNRKSGTSCSRVFVMGKQSGWGTAFPKKFLNADWDFGIFSTDGNVLDKNLNACRSCHPPLQKTQHIFLIAALGE
jgi:hypothetical protein